MSHRHIRIFCKFTSCVVAFASQVVADTNTPTQPHIVLFVSDDMGWNDVGYHGSVIETRNIDQLAQQGVRLDRFYVHPICSPTRAALMTGRSPVRFGITSPLSGHRAVPLNEHFMPEDFQAAGYQTSLVGKWHLGAVGVETGPNRRGFHHFYGLRGGMIDYYTHSHHGVLDWQRNGKPLTETGYSTDLIAKEAVGVIDSHDRSKPMFLYVPFNAPHGPLQAPADIVQKYAGLGRRATYAAAVHAMDQAIGQILHALEERDMTHNTIVMFFCDNGSKERTGGSQSRGNEAQFLALRGGKGELFEGGIRVPAVLRWPARVKPGTTCQQMLSVLDLYPTLAAAAAVPLNNSQPLDGINVWPAIETSNKVTRAAIVIGGSRQTFAVLSDPLKLIASPRENLLYDIRQDPTESSNLAAQRATDVKNLLAQLELYGGLESAVRPTRQNSPRRNRPPRRPRR